MTIREYDVSSDRFEGTSVVRRSANIFNLGGFEEDEEEEGGGSSVIAKDDDFSATMSAASLVHSPVPLAAGRSACEGLSVHCPAPDGTADATASLRRVMATRSSWPRRRRRRRPAGRPLTVRPCPRPHRKAANFLEKVDVESISACRLFN